MIRTKGEAGTGDVVEAVAHMRKIVYEIAKVKGCKWEELYTVAKEIQAPLELVQQVHQTGKLPVPNFSAGGIATPADAALVMQLGAESVFVGSGIFKSADPARRAKAMVEAVLFYDQPKKLAEISRNLGAPMVGMSAAALAPEELLATRGW